MAIQSFFGPGVPGFIDRDGNKYAPNANGIFIIDSKYAFEAQQAGLSRAFAEQCVILAPIAAELVSIKAAAIAANGAITIAAQPDCARKLQVRQVIVTAITGGLLTLTGVGINGQTLSEVLSLIAASTQTLKTANAFLNLTAGVVSGLVGGGDGTLGIGVAADLALPTQSGVNGGSMQVLKEKVGTTAEAIGTIDTVAGTISPTSAPDGTKNFTINYLC